MRNTRNVCVTSSVRRPEEGRGRLRVSEKRREGKKSNPKKKGKPDEEKTVGPRGAALVGNSHKRNNDEALGKKTTL